MDEHIDKRCMMVAEYMVAHRATVRQAAQAFGLSKSLVHKDMGERLSRISPALGAEVARLLQHNKAVRHLRGGAATRRRYRAQALQNSADALY